MLTHAADVDGVDPPAVKEVEFRIGPVAAIAEGKPQPLRLREGILRQFAMAGGDHEAVFVVGDRQIAIHLFDLLNAEAHLFNGAGYR